MRILIAPDSFKECLSASEVAQAIAQGWQSVRPGDHLDLAPIADGGEGTVDAILAATGGTRLTATVTGPLGAPLQANYGLLEDKTAIIEMAAASGLALVPTSQRDPAHTTTRGTGELLQHATQHGALHIVLGIGGSATNDAGAGMLQALGYRLQDAAGHELPPGAAPLIKLAAIHPPSNLQLPPITVACDVNNPLLGPNGATHIYGPKKGAAPAQLNDLEHALTHFADIAATIAPHDHRNTPGAGAAGGLGYALLTFLHATLRPGIEIIAQLTNLEERIAQARLIITGEGRVDAQTLMGKAIGGIHTLATRHNTPIIILTGALGPGHHALPCPIHPIAPPGTPAQHSITHARQYLQSTAAQLAQEHNAAS